MHSIVGVCMSVARFLVRGGGAAVSRSVSPRDTALWQGVALIFEVLSAAR